MNGAHQHNQFEHACPVVDLLPSWDQSEDALTLDGFDQFMAMLPNFTTPAVRTEDTPTVQQANGGPSARTTSSTSDRLSSYERTKQKNNLAQRRFRERQKARFCDYRNAGQPVHSPCPTAVCA